jgi:hypothetical protein
MIVTYNGVPINLNGSIINYKRPYGSLYLLGDSTSNLSLTNEVDFRMGTGDFTIEWFQYRTDNNTFPRLFQIGDYPTTSIGVSLESGTFYFWSSGSPISFGSHGPLNNTWVHFAITRTSGVLRAFKNGTQLGTDINNTDDFDDTLNTFRIGNESTPSNGASFGGYITNFHWVKGVSKYITNFTVPTDNINPIPESKLLLLATNNSDLIKDSSGTNKIVTNNNVTWSDLTPF